MMLTIFKVVILLAILVIPLRGPRRKESSITDPEKTSIHSNYGVNEFGELEEIFNENKDI